MRRPRPQAAAAWIGVAVCVLGVATLAGVLGHVPSLAAPAPQRDAAVALSSAISLVLAGLAVAAVAWLPRHGWVARGLALALAALGGLGAAENLADVNLGFDWPQLHYWMGGPALRPGRMAPVTAVAFLLAAAAILTLLDAPRARRAHAVLAGLLGVTSLVGLLAYGLHVEVIFPFHGMPAMAPVSGFALLALTVGLGLLARSGSWRAGWAQLAPSHRVLTVAAAVLVLVLAGAGISSLVLLQSMSRRDAITELTLRRDERTHYIAMLIADALARGRDLAARPELATMLRTGSAGALPSLPQAFRSLRLQRPDGRVAATLGSPQPLSLQLAVRLPGTIGAQLIWSDGFYLQQRLPVRSRGANIGEAVVEQPLPLLVAIGIETASWGATGEMGLCGRTDTTHPVLACFPLRMLKQPFELSTRFHAMARPMTLAVKGQSGAEIATDYRGQRVLAAYGPVPGTGLGLVVKMDTSELYAFTRRQLEVMLPLLAALVVAGLFLLYWQVRPLVQDLVRSRNDALRNEARFRAAASSSLDAFFIFEAERDPASGGIADFHLTFANDNAARLAGAARAGDDLRDMPLLAHSGFHEAFARVLSTQRALDDEMPLADQPDLWWHRQIVALGDGVAMTVRDISERKRDEQNLRHLAQRDPLTGLANRRTFLARLGHAMATSRRLRHQALLAVLFLDLDRFKRVNDALGHAQGDRLLQIVAHRLGGCVRHADTVARIGGDEFTLLLENLEGPEDAERVVHCIFRSLDDPVLLDNAAVRTRASIGVAYYAGENLAPHELVARADTALYEAKRAGRNDFRVFAA